MKEPLPVLSPRLKAVAALVSPGARLVDVGTDHAYLPTYLALTDGIEEALATDIADGPVRRAQSTVRAFGVSERVRVRKAPGLSGAESFHPTDVVIAGMGGELIASILEEARSRLDERTKLILQPMTKAEILRAYLARVGFEIGYEEIVAEGRRLYTLIVCRPGGTPYELTPLEELIGRRNLEKTERNDEKTAALLEKKLKELKKSAQGKARGGVLTDRDRALITALEEELKRRGEKT